MTTGRINQVAVRNKSKTRDYLESRGPYRVGAAAFANTVDCYSCTERFTTEPTEGTPSQCRDIGPTDNRQISCPQMYFLTRQRDTIARTMEPIWEQDDRTDRALVKTTALTVVSRIGRPNLAAGYSVENPPLPAFRKVLAVTNHLRSDGTPRRCLLHVVNQHRYESVSGSLTHTTRLQQLYTQLQQSQVSNLPVRDFG